MKKLTTRQIALNGVAAGLYAAITILTASFAYGNIQFRIADALCVLVVSASISGVLCRWPSTACSPALTAPPSL